MNFKNSIIIGSKWTPTGDASHDFNIELDYNEKEYGSNDYDDSDMSSVVSANPAGPATAGVGDDYQQPQHRHKVFNTSEVKETFASLADAGTGIYFSDGVKRVDFVLVYHKFQLSEVQEKQRQFFQENLIKDGLELESEYPEASSVEGQIFCKVHAPWKTLCKQAELLHLKMPLKLEDICMDDEVPPPWYQKFVRLLSLNNAKVADFATEMAPNVVHVHQAFARKKMHRFQIDDKNTFFSPVQRLELVFEILQSVRNDPKDDKNRGIESLLDKKVYEHAFPLHDGKCDVQPGTLPSDWCIRQTLRRTWARWGCTFKQQPFELIRKYYGEKIGFYFAFLDFYTKWLSFPAIGGLLSFCYGLGAASTDKIVEDFCDENSAPGNFTMCPMCQPPNCEPFVMADEGCKLIKWDFRMDNEATLVLACLSVIWATAFIKMWKRREAELAYRWDTFDLETEDVVIRPSFEEQAKERRENPVTKEMEPYVPQKTKIIWKSVSVIVTLLLLLCVTAMLVALVLVRIRLYGAYRHLGGTFEKFNVEWSRWTVHGLIFITVVIFEKIYHTVALKLTNWECPKTQSEYISSFLWKVFLFELVNDFVPISYAAWFKGRLVGTPLDLDYKSELCDPGGCLAEVVELIAVLLLARLIIGNLAEIGIPFLSNLIEQRMHKSSNEFEHDTLPQYRKDYRLAELELDGVAEEYMEMIVQFAFVTLFVPAFPLAAMVCLLNNVAEIRVDAINFVTAHRRPLPIRVPGIQIWNEFLDVITKLAILVNAALIAFTSELLPRFFYKQGHYDNYGDFSMSSINMEEFGNEEIEKYMEHHENVTECWYQDYRNPNHPYDRNELWWRIMVLRVGGFVSFMIFFFIFHWMFNFLVSDVPSSVDMKIRRRKYVLSKATDNDVVDKWLGKKNSDAPIMLPKGFNKKQNADDHDHENTEETEINNKEINDSIINYADDTKHNVDGDLNSIGGSNSNNFQPV